MYLFLPGFDPGISSVFKFCIWKNFVNSLDKLISNNKFINNINYSTQNVITTENNNKYERLKKQYSDLKESIKDREFLQTVK